MDIVLGDLKRFS